MPSEFKVFPKDETEALAYLYVKSQDLSGKSPAEIHAMYQEAYFEIAKDSKIKLRDGWYSQKRSEV